MFIYLIQEATDMSTSSGNVLFFFGILLLGSTFGETSHPKDPYARRLRRSVSQLSSMVSDVTGRQSSDFISYGNWCGLGGSGRPVDPIDECCQIHDLCYNLATQGPCESMGEKIAYHIEYKWRKEKDGSAICDKESDKCKTTVCMCDAMLTNCLKDNLESYNPQNLHKLSFYELLQEANWVSSD